jgi:hypothetical protein
LRLLSFSPSARSASSATRVALQSRSRSLSLSERTEKPPFGGLFLLRNGHRPVRKSCLSGLFPGARTDQDGPNGLSAVGRCGHGRTSRLPRRTLWVRFRFQSGVQGRRPLALQYVGSGRLLRAHNGRSTAIRRTVTSDGKRWAVAPPRPMRRQRRCLERRLGGYRGKETAGSPEPWHHIFTGS